jgi:hypothetical protein
MLHWLARASLSVPFFFLRLVGYLTACPCIEMCLWPPIMRLSSAFICIYPSSSFLVDAALPYSPLFSSAPLLDLVTAAAALLPPPTLSLSSDPAW